LLNCSSYEKILFSFALLFAFANYLIAQSESTISSFEKKMKYLLILSLLFMSDNIAAQKNNNYQRLVKIVVDSAQLEAYKIALKEGTETSVREESGVLSYQIYAEKEHPNHITIFETYSSVEAYTQHIQTPHFKQYKAAVANMVLSLHIVDVLPLAEVKKKKSKKN
jgi:quinol monooxygenase YgiN